MLPWFRIPANITLLSKTCQKLLFAIEFPYNFSSQLTLKISKRKKPIYPNQETYPISRENRIVIRDPSSMWLQRDLTKYLRNITRVKTHRDKIPKFTREYQLVEILPQINLICNILRTGGKTKLFFRWGVILKVGLHWGYLWDGFSRGTETELRKKWSFLLRISSVNVTKSAGNWKSSFLCSAGCLRSVFLRK